MSRESPMELESYYREVADRILELRASGFALSSLEDDALRSWFEDGAPVEVVLQELEDEARRALDRKNKRLGLARVGKRVAKRRPAEGWGSQAPEVEQRGEGEDLVQALWERAQGLEQAQDLLPALQSLLEEAADLPAVRVRARLSSLQRRHRDALVNQLHPEERNEMEEQIQKELSRSLRRMSAKARVETLEEHLRRRVAKRDELFQDSSP